MQTVTQTQNLSKSYGITAILKNIDLMIHLGEITAVMGTFGLREIDADERIVYH